MLPCEYCKIFKNTCLEEHQRKVTSGLRITRFIPLVSFHCHITTWKTRSFLMFSGGRKTDQWHIMGWLVQLFHYNYFNPLYTIRCSLFIPHENISWKNILKNNAWFVSILLRKSIWSDKIVLRWKLYFSYKKYIYTLSLVNVFFQVEKFA